MKKYSMRIGIAIILFISLFYFIIPYLGNLQPELPRLVAFIKEDAALKKRFGNIIGIKRIYGDEEFGWEFTPRGTFSGSNKFNIEGTVRAGVVLIRWQSLPNHQLSHIEVADDAGVVLEEWTK